MTPSGCATQQMSISLRSSTHATWPIKHDCWTPRRNRCVKARGAHDGAQGEESGGATGGREKERREWWSHRWKREGEKRVVEPQVEERRREESGGATGGREKE